jgi:hypothetical protein
VGGICQIPLCSDGVKNGDETDVDCGGSCPNRCALGKGCQVSGDCDKVVCDARVCRLPVSCKELRAQQPSLGDGKYQIAPNPSEQGQTFEAWCDMTNDGGGWMLVTADMLAGQVNNSVTVVNQNDSHGGLIQTTYANDSGCGARPYSSAMFLLKDLVRWTHIRYSKEFLGSNSCWGIFGNTGYHHPNTIQANIVPYNPVLDTIRNQHRMGGNQGNNFDGISSRCDNERENFWHDVNGTAQRRAQVILRRDISNSNPAGLSTGVSCTRSGSGTSSPTYWIYRDIFIR